MVGADGAATLLLSNLVILMSAGVSLAWVHGHVCRVAQRASAVPPPADVALVLGLRLRDQQVAQPYAERLLRASLLHKQGSIRRILVLGGRTGGADGHSEAEQGRRFLISRGLPADRVLVEEDSIHTLENLRNARTALGGDGSAPVVLITSRYHLARSAAMAAGFGLRPVPCPAEDRLAPTLRTCLLLLREAWFLHWYYVGRAWSQWSGNKKSLARIS